MLRVSGGSGETGVVKAMTACGQQNRVNSKIALSIWYSQVLLLSVEDGRPVCERDGQVLASPGVPVAG